VTLSAQGALHPNSRKAAQKQGELIHDDKKAMHILTKDLKWKPQRENHRPTLAPTVPCTPLPRR